MYKTNEKTTFIKTAPQTAMYPHLLQPRQDPWGNDNYEVTLLLDDAARKDVEDAIKAEYAAHKAALADGKGKIPPIEAIHWPLWYCDDPEKKDLFERWCIKFKTTYKPDVIDAYKEEITDPAELYSGMLCRVAGNLKCYRNGNNVGISAYLQAVQKKADGERLGGRLRAADLFSAATGEDEEDELPF